MTALEAFGSWLGHHIAAGMVWFDKLPGKVQALFVIVLALGLMLSGSVWDRFATWRYWNRLQREIRRRRGAMGGER